MFIKIKNYTGMYNCNIIPLRKDNLEKLKGIIPIVYNKEYGEHIPEFFKRIKTIVELKEFIKEYMDDMDTYPFGFKHIDGVYCFYEVYG